MASDVDIVNLALGRIGHKQRLSSLTDSGVVAAHARNIYTQTRDSLIEQYDWPWAERVEALAPNGEVVPGWDYVYAYPLECLSLKFVCDEAGARAWARQSRTRTGFVTSDPFRLFDTDSGKSIATDLQNAYAVFARRITDATRFSPLFVSALAWAMAPDLGLLLQVDAKTLQMALQMAAISRTDAAAASRNETIDDPPQDARSIQARG